MPNLYYRTLFGSEPIIRFYNVKKREFIDVHRDEISKKIRISISTSNKKKSPKRYRYIVCRIDDDGTIMNKHCSEQDWNTFDVPIEERHSLSV